MCFQEELPDCDNPFSPINSPHDHLAHYGLPVTTTKELEDFSKLLECNGNRRMSSLKCVNLALAISKVTPRIKPEHMLKSETKYNAARELSQKIAPANVSEQCLSCYENWIVLLQKFLIKLILLMFRILMYLY